jgi:integrase
MPPWAKVETGSASAPLASKAAERSQFFMESNLDGGCGGKPHDLRKARTCRVARRARVFSDVLAHTSTTRRRPRSVARARASVITS